VAEEKAVIHAQTQATDLRATLDDCLRRAQENRSSYLDVRAADLTHDHPVTIVCRVMREAMTAHDRILAVPVHGDGPHLIVRYVLPRALPDA
jgi:hypothetical protein